MKAAMKAREKARLSTIRMLSAALKNEEIAKKRPLDEHEELAFLARQAKQRRESIAAFDEGGRAELAEKERAELVVVQAYLPAQLSEGEVRDIVSQAIANLGATSKRDMGKVMGAVMPKTKGRYDGKAVKDIVMGLLP